MTNRTRSVVALLVLTSCAMWPVAAKGQDPDIIVVGGQTAGGAFRIIVQRDSLVDGTVFGTISVNGQVLGTTYENPQLMIAADVYYGAVRYSSPTAKSGGHAQGPGGAMGRQGDFLLDVVDAKADDDGRPKSNILFHGGVRPGDSQGCIMLGPVHKTKEGVRYLLNSDPLRQLRLLFYDGVDDPVQSPNKHITIDVRDVPTGNGLP